MDNTNNKNIFAATNAALKREKMISHLSQITAEYWREAALAAPKDKRYMTKRAHAQQRATDRYILKAKRLENTLCS